jgi:predicted tellurium resistance membrane protein TerC
MLDHVVTLLFLVLLQAVLGFDNLLYLSLESKRAPAESRAMVRRAGIIIAVVLRIVLLFVLLQIIESVQEPLFSLPFEGFAEGQFNLH